MASTQHPNIRRFEDVLRQAKVDEDRIRQVMGVAYARDEEDDKQDVANFYAAALRRCEELLDFDTLSEVMFCRACCKSGFRLQNARQFAKLHAGEPLERRLALLGELRYMGKPGLNGDGDIETVAVGEHGASGMRCPCWNFQGRLPVDGPMPLSYCLCCAGHFRFHYQKALGLRLRIKRVVSSMLNSEGRSPCVFVYEIADAGSKSPA